MTADVFETSGGGLMDGVPLPSVVTAAEWQAAADELLVKEQQVAQARDALAAERRRLPMVSVDTAYAFEGPDGEVSLLDLFAGRRQLIVQRFFFEPGVDGWPEAGCVGCSMFTDQLGHIAHLHARDTSLVLASGAPQANIESYKTRMGWTLPWVSTTDDFSKDFWVDEYFGLNVFLRDGHRVFHTYFVDGPGTGGVGSIWSLLDLTPFGRQETSEDSPDGWPQTEPGWFRRHDEYDTVPS